MISVVIEYSYSIFTRAKVHRAYVSEELLRCYLVQVVMTRDETKSSVHWTMTPGQVKITYMGSSQPVISLTEPFCTFALPHVISGFVVNFGVN